MLQFRDAVRCPAVIFTTQTEGVVTTDVKAVAVNRCITVGVPVPAHCFLGNLLQADTFNSGRRAGEITIDKVGAQADGIEYLCTAIGLVGRNAHLGHHLEQTLADCLDIAFLCFI